MCCMQVIHLALNGESENAMICGLDKRYYFYFYLLKLIFCYCKNYSDFKCAVYSSYPVKIESNIKMNNNLLKICMRLI